MYLDPLPPSTLLGIFLCRHRRVCQNNWLLVLFFGGDEATIFGVLGYRILVVGGPSNLECPFREAIAPNLFVAVGEKGALWSTFLMLFFVVEIILENIPNFALNQRWMNHFK